MLASKKLFTKQSFDLSSLRSGVITPDELVKLRSALYSDGALQILKDSVHERGFVFLYTIIDDQLESRIRNVLLAEFPRDSMTFVDSFAVMLLQELENQFESLSSCAESLRTCYPDRPHDEVELTNRLLKQFPVLRETLQDSNNVNPRGALKGKQPSERNRGRIDIDTRTFQDCDLKIPDSIHDLGELEEDLISNQRFRLIAFLDALRTDFNQTIQGPLEGLSYNDVSLSSYGVGTIAKPSRSPALSISSTPTSARHPVFNQLKAALMFPKAEGLGAWPVIVSSRFIRDLRRESKGGIYEIITRKLGELSRGDFSPRNNQIKFVLDHDVPLYRARLDGAHRLVYQVDVVPDDQDTQSEIQALRIFGVYDCSEIKGRRWAGFAKQIVNKGPEYIKKCTSRFVDGLVYKPGTWPAQSPSFELTTNCAPLHIDDEHQEMIHDLSVLEKYVPFSQALVESILANVDAKFPFILSHQEREIVEHPSSCYVLGRSGTGKTTAMLYKMLSYERLQISYDTAGAGFVGGKRRQLFITKSRTLARRVEEYFTSLAKSLDRTFNLTLGGVAGRQLDSDSVASDELIFEDDGDIDKYRPDLPLRFSELKDDHFPLFLTFDKLYRLLENDYDLFFSKRARTSDYRKAVKHAPSRSNQYDEGSQVSDKPNGLPMTFIDFDEFHRNYWPSYSCKLDPVLVFGEIMGVIKGSEEALMCPNKYLDLDAYLSTSTRKQRFAESQRAEVYSLFERYQKMRGNSWSYDGADRAHAILEKLKESPISNRIDNVYVDEVQDNLLIDCLVLRSLTSNPDGLFWAGDSAQTITVGSTFSFDALKALLYRVDMANQKTRFQKGQTVPKFYQLNVNHRSHRGITNCANTIVQLILEFWPNTIDRLKPESGLADGPKPVFIKDDFARHRLHFGNRTPGQSLDFGAKQCFLVRNEDTRRELREVLGKATMVLTLYESKGLEFDDVFLYKFFETSPIDEKRWKLVLNAVPACTSRPDIYAPKFDGALHAGVCNELKFLYVAFTRARNNLWIIDESECGEPMRYLLESLDQVKTGELKKLLPKLVVYSTPEEWIKQGRTLFQAKLFEQAHLCFIQANAHKEARVAKAYLLRDEAQKLLQSQKRESRTQFLEAARAFEGCSKESSHKKRLMELAGQCFVMADDYPAAGTAFVQAESYEDAVVCFKKATLIDKAVEIVNKNGDTIADDLVDSVKKMARLYYLRKGCAQLEKAKEVFDSVEDEIEFIEDAGLEVDQVAVYEHEGLELSAAKVQLSQGRVNEAKQVILSHPEEHECVAELVLGLLWKCGALGYPQDGVSFPESHADLIALAAQFDKERVRLAVRHEIAAFRHILLACYSEEDVLTLCSKLLKDHALIPAAIRLFDHFLYSLAPESLQRFDETKKMKIMELFYEYTCQLQKYSRNTEPCDNSDVANLFGFRKLEGDSSKFEITENTALHMCLGEGEDHCVDGQTVNNAIKQCIETRLCNVTKFLFGIDKAVVTKEPEDRAEAPTPSFPNTAGTREEASRSGAGAGPTPPLDQSLPGGAESTADSGHALTTPSLFPKGFTPCLQSLLSRGCNVQPCRHEHVKCDVPWYRERCYRVTLKLSAIWEANRSVAGLREVLHFPTLEEYFRLFYAPDIDMGHLPLCVQADVLSSPEQMFHAKYAEKTVTSWAHSNVIRMDTEHAGKRHFLSRLYMRAVLIFAYKQQHSAWAVFTRSKIFKLSRYSAHWLYRPEQGVWKYIVHDLLDFVSAKGASFLTSGIRFLQHTVDSGIYFDSGYLCHFLERMFSAISILANYQDRRCTIHNLLLPSSWILKTLPQLKFGYHRVPYSDTLSLIPAIVCQILTTSYAKRNTVRICRLLCMLGSNVADLRNGILDTFKVLNDHDNQSYRRYANVSRWEELEKTSAQTLPALSAVEEVVNILYAPWSSQGRGIPDVKIVRYQRMEELYATLRQIGGIGPGTTPASHHFGRPATENDAVVAPGSLANDEPDVHPESGQEALKAHEYTATEVKAVCMLQSFVRGALKKIKARPTEEAHYRLIGNNYRAYYDCAEKIRGLQRRDYKTPTYRKLLLSIAPHLVLIIDEVRKAANNEREILTKLGETAEGDKLEEVAQGLDGILRTLKGCRRLTTDLNPKSIQHEKGDVRQFRENVRATLTLAKDVGLCSEDVELVQGLSKGSTCSI